MQRPLIGFILATFSVCAFAWATPEQAITEFLKFELNGGRLSSAGWSDYTSKYLYAPQDYDEPGWDMAIVVNSYSVGDIKCNTPTLCTADVVFELYPTANLKKDQIVMHEQGGKDTQHYSLVSMDNKWRLAPNPGMPRITIETLHKFLPDRL